MGRRVRIETFLQCDKCKCPDFQGARWCFFGLAVMQWKFLAGVRGSHITVMGLLERGPRGVVMEPASGVRGPWRHDTFVIIESHFWVLGC